MLALILRKRVGVILLFALLCATGLGLISQLPIQLYPRTNRPRTMAVIRHEGYSAIGFSEQFGEMIESTLLGVNGVDVLEVTYGSDQSRFMITFDWETEPEPARDEMQAAVDTATSLLPSQLQGNSRVHFFTGENAGFLMLGVHTPSATTEELYQTLVQRVESSLSQVEDVDTVEIFNIEDLRASVTLRQDDLLSYGLTINDVNAAMRSDVGLQSVGRLIEGGKRFSVRYARGSADLFDIGTLPITEVGGMTVTLEDVADVEVRYTLPAATFVMDGSRGIQITATPVDGGNIRSMSENVVGVLEDAKADGVLPADTEITLFLDPGAYIDRSIASVVQAALIGAGLAMVVVFLALGEVRNTVLIGISLPLTLILSFILMYAFGVSLNLISLGGMALAVGMIVDPSIVVMENIHRFRVDEAHSHERSHLKDLIVRAVAQVRSPVIASILTSILVFLPISFTAPLTNAILGDQARVVVFALVFSLLVALTIIPLVAFLLYGRHRPPKRPPGPERSRRRNISLRVMDALDRLYLRVLRPVVSHRLAAAGLILGSAALLVAAILFVLPQIPKEILAPPASDRVIVFMRPADEVDSVEMVEEVFPAMDAQIREAVGEYVAGTYAEIRGRFNRLFVVMKSPRDTDHVMGELQRLFVSDNDWYYNIMSWDPAQLPLPRSLSLQIRVRGPDQTEIVSLLERIRDLVTETELYPWVATTPQTSYADQLIMHPRPEVIGTVPGYSESSLLSVIRRALSGTQSLELEHEGFTVSVRGEYPDGFLQGRENLANFLLPYRETAIPVKHFFDFEESTTVAQIVSENGEPVFRVFAVMNRGEPATNRAAYEDQVREKLGDELTVPEGYSVEFENPQAELDAAIESLFISLALSIGLIYLVLAFQFNSLVVPLVILVSVPLGFIGLVFSLSVFGSTLSLNSLLGAILLSGIVVNNAIILIDFYRKSLSGYADHVAALLHTAKIRFRPIVITMLTTVMGMLPIAVGLGEGSNVIKPLGIAVSGGLFVSTLLTLFVVPAILSLVHIKSADAE